jgi:hypothetical protein
MGRGTIRRMVEGKCGPFENVLNDVFKALKHLGNNGTENHEDG